MRVTAQQLIKELPPYEDKWLLIKDNQVVKDIIREVLAAHDEFAPYYDNIALYFDGKNASAICDNLYSFIKRNIKYKEESEEDQTTSLPAGVLIRGIGDCKHYSGFAGGILDALNRAGKNIDWCYCFASYKWIDSTPHHVFIKVFDGDKELWFDPTPSANDLEPVWMVNKKIKSGNMALRRNIAGIEYLDYEDLGRSAIGANWQMYASQGAQHLDHRMQNPYFAGIPFLSLEFYGEDNLSIKGNDWQKTTDSINAEIAKKGLSHSFPKDFVKWVYDSNMKGWNFYWPMGAPVGFKPNLPPDYMELVITDDGRLTFDRDVKLDDHLNAETQALTAWAQSLINEYDPTPYPVKPQHIKEFSQLKYGSVNDRNLFTERRGENFFKKVGEGIVKALKVVKDGVFKIVGSIPRNAFLAMVGTNLFGFATKMNESIEEGNWDKMAKKWKSLGGNPEKLLGTINDGKNKKEVLGHTSGNIVGTNSIGEPITASAIVAAAAPIIAAMLAFIKDPDGKLNNVLQATKASMAKFFPNVDFTPLGFLDKSTGKEIEFEVDAIDDENQGGGNDKLPGEENPLDDLKDLAEKNPLGTAAVIGIGTYLLTNKGKVSGRSNLLLPLAAAGISYFLLSRKTNGNGDMIPDDKEAALITWIDSEGSAGEKEPLKIIFRKMTDQEIIDVYDFIFNYFKKGLKIPTGTPLYNRIQSISTKYDIFT